jgi:hypothetical protein
MTVDEALRLYPKPPFAGSYGGKDWVQDSEAAGALAAEVRRLRGETEIRRIEHLDACKVIDRLRNAMLAIKLAAFRVHKESADIANLACDASAEIKP